MAHGSAWQLQDDLVSELHLTIPVLACHQHFLADVGKDLLEPAHAELRGLFRRFEVRSNLRALVRDLGRELGTDIEEARQAVLEWQQSLADAEHRIDPGRDGKATVRALAQWVLNCKAQATGLDFPFDRPYLDLFDRSIRALRATDAFLRTPPEDQKVTRLLKRFHRYLKPVASEVPFRKVAARLCRRAVLFVGPARARDSTEREASAKTGGQSQDRPPDGERFAVASGSPRGQDRGNGPPHRCRSPESGASMPPLTSTAVNPTGS